MNSIDGLNESLDRYVDKHRQKQFDQSLSALQLEMAKALFIERMKKFPEATDEAVVRFVDESMRRGLIFSRQVHGVRPAPAVPPVPSR